MSEVDRNQPEPGVVEIRPAPIVGSGALLSVTITVLHADRIEVEDADRMKYLRLRSGDIELPNRVFLIVEGQRMEITVDELPKDVH